MKNLRVLLSLTISAALGYYVTVGLRFLLLEILHMYAPINELGLLYALGAHFIVAPALGVAIGLASLYLMPKIYRAWTFVESPGAVGSAAHENLGSGDVLEWSRRPARRPWDLR